MQADKKEKVKPCRRRVGNPTPSALRREGGKEMKKIIARIVLGITLGSGLFFILFQLGYITYQISGNLTQAILAPIGLALAALATVWAAEYI